MDRDDRERVSIYIDKELLADIDRIKKKKGFKSRNEFIVTALEKFVACETVIDNDDIGVIIAESIDRYSEENRTIIAKGLFRYAVQLEMLMRMIARNSKFSDVDISEFEREAVNNVRRKRGKVDIKEIAKGYYYD